MTADLSEVRALLEEDPDDHTLVPVWLSPNRTVHFHTNDLLAAIERAIEERDKTVTQEFTAEIADLVDKNERLRGALDKRDRLLFAALGILSKGTPGEYWMNWSSRVRKLFDPETFNLGGPVYGADGNVDMQRLWESLSDLPRQTFEEALNQARRIGEQARAALEEGEHERSL